MKGDYALLILELARKRGMLPPGQEAETPAAQLARLVGEGAIGAQTVADLGREIAAGSMGASTQGAAPGGAVRPQGDRYEVGELLGAGGMGRVYKAHDRLLGRHVALKILRGDEPGSAGRILHEARAQARIDHPHVCKVFDSGGEGESGGAYIAMQLIEGRPLSLLASDLALQDKIEIMAAVAEGVHAAHRIGLVHRDLKPGNILVAAGDDGFHPYVTDFGLAGELGTPLALATGQVVGTPQFMSPEQARGQKVLDGRSDVYSLGATLFALLAGRPPFDGAVAEVLHDILVTDAPRLRGLPRELATIVEKCLEKDAARRYASARELAEDLRRYLAREPIRAHPPSLGYRLRKQLARHRVLVAGVVVGVVGLVTAGAVWMRSRWVAADRATAALRFGQQVERIDDSLNRAYMLPLHDVRPERARVRAEMENIAAEMARVGGEVRGPGELALGRGALALGDAEAARAHLERAWAAGYREPEVDYALGLALGRLYQTGLERAARTESPEDGERLRNLLAFRLRDPALAHLRAARGAGTGTRAYVEALIALYEGRFDDAIARADAAFAEAPWLARAKQLAADARLGRARQLRDQARDADALEEARRAAPDLRAALAIAKSDPDVLGSECERLFETMTLAGDLKQPYEPPAEEALAACSAGLQADADDVELLARRARTYFGRATLRNRYHGQSAFEDLSQAIADASRVLAIDPEHSEALLARGRARQQRAMMASDAGGDPLPDFRGAIVDLERANAIRPLGFVERQSLGTTFARIGWFEEMHGRDPVPYFDEAVRHLTYAAASPRAGVASESALQLGYALKTRAEHERRTGGRWRPWLARAVEAHARACGLRESGACVVQLANVYSSLAQFEAEENGDATGARAAADAAYRRGLALAPQEGELWRMYGYHLGNLAGLLAEQGEDPVPALRASLASLEQAVALKPNDIGARFGVPEIWLTLAEHTIAGGGDPRTPLEQARATLATAMRMHPGHPFVLLTSCQLDVLRAEAALRRRRDPGPALGAAARDLARLRSVGGPPVEMLGFVARAARVRGEWLVLRRRAPAAALAPGIAAAQTALQLRPGDRVTARLLAELLVVRARGEEGAARGDAAAALDRAQALAPRDPRLRALRAALDALH